MHQRPFITSFPATGAAKSDIEITISNNAVVVFARRGCCLCYVVKLLLNYHGVAPTLFDVDESNEADVESELTRITGRRSMVTSHLPVVFVGGELFGGLEDIVGAHISEELVPRLRKARALWL